MSPHLVPTDADELVRWLEDGTLVEGPTLDFKRQLGLTDSARRELAKDVAAMANNGGRLILGVDKPADGRPPTPFPIPLAGLAERVDQITRSRLDEPLIVSITELPVDDDGNGFLIVIVPPSADAPHMVDSRYWGRADVSNYPMPDAEVRQLHKLRAVRDRDVSRLLSIEIERDPWPAQETAHLFVVAQPTTEDPERLLRVIGDGPHEWIQREVLDGRPCRYSGSYWSPDLGNMTSHVWRRANGWAVTTYEVGPGRSIRPNGEHPAQEKNLLELEIGEDGGLRLFCGRASDHGRALEELVAGLAKRVLLAGQLVAGASGYVGSWDLGVAITGLAGAVTHLAQNWLSASPSPVYSEDSYEASVRTTLEQLQNSPDELVGRLVSRLYRALGREFDPDQLPV